jgi:hypothetical protein
MKMYNLIITRKQPPWYLCTVKLGTVHPSEIVVTSCSTVQSYNPSEHLMNIYFRQNLKPGVDQYCLMCSYYLLVQEIHA